MRDLREIVERIPGLNWYKLPKPRGRLGVLLLGHRGYVGGRWDEFGGLQFEFLVEQGLRPQHVLLDIGCGSLRGGVRFIPYLQSGHYLGIEPQPELLRLGVARELGRELHRQKRPQLVVSERFDFDRFTLRPDYALAHSLFSHLPTPLIEECLARLRTFIRPQGRFYATFLEVETGIENPPKAHPHRAFRYTRQQMEAWAARNGWKPEYIGDWEPSAIQKMMRFLPA